jgi:hypothetical protein
MKKIIYSGLLLLVINFIPSLVSADLGPPPGSHNVSLCSKIVNQNEYPDIFLISHSTGPMSDKSVGNLIENDECIVGGYKFSSLNIYSVSKEDFKSIDLKNLKLKTTKVKGGGMDVNGNPAYYDEYFPEDLNLLFTQMPFYGGFESDNSHISNKTVEYLITKGQDNNLTLLKSKQIISYNNGDSDKVETFSVSIKKDINLNEKDIEDISKNQEVFDQEGRYFEQKPTPIKRGFWQSLMCFFRIGKNC